MLSSEFKSFHAKDLKARNNLMLTKLFQTGLIAPVGFIPRSFQLYDCNDKGKPVAKQGRKAMSLVRWAPAQTRDRQAAEG